MTELGARSDLGAQRKERNQRLPDCSPSVNWRWLVDATLSLAEIRFGLLYGSNAGRRLKRSNSRRASRGNSARLNRGFVSAFVNDGDQLLRIFDSLHSITVDEECRRSQDIIRQSEPDVFRYHRRRSIGREAAISSRCARRGLLDG